MADFVLALDQGTTSSRALLFDRSGAIVSVDQYEFPQSFPKPGWVEHDPFEIWDSQLRAARGALEKAGVAASQLAAIGITNQRETTVVWDRRTGEPIHPAIVWQSRQTAAICDELRSRGLEDEVRKRTGLVIDAYFSATKVRFILDAVDGAQQRAERGELAFGTIDSWLLYKLSGGRVHATEVSNASRTLIYNIHECQWDELLLGELRIPRAMLPEVRLDALRVGGLRRELVVLLAPGQPEDEAQELHARIDGRLDAGLGRRSGRILVRGCRAQQREHSEDQKHAHGSSPSRRTGARIRPDDGRRLILRGADSRRRPPCWGRRRLGSRSKGSVSGGNEEGHGVGEVR